MHIIVDSVGCVFNIMEWLNRRVNQMPIKGPVNLEFHQLIYPTFMDNYPDTPLAKYFSDMTLVEHLLSQDSVYSINMVDGVREAMNKIRDMGVKITLVMPFSLLGRRLESIRMLEELPMDVHHYISSSEKYPEQLTHDATFVVDDLKEECDDLVGKGINALLLDMPWNKGATKGHRMNDWAHIVKYVEKEIASCTENKNEL